MIFDRAAHLGLALLANNAWVHDAGPGPHRRAPAERADAGLLGPDAYLALVETHAGELRGTTGVRVSAPWSSPWVRTLAGGRSEPVPSVEFTLEDSAGSYFGRFSRIDDLGLMQLFTDDGMWTQNFRTADGGSTFVPTAQGARLIPYAGGSTIRSAETDGRLPVTRCSHEVTTPVYDHDIDFVLAYSSVYGCNQSDHLYAEASLKRGTGVGWALVDGPHTDSAFDVVLSVLTSHDCVGTQLNAFRAHGSGEILGGSPASYITGDSVKLNCSF